MGKTVSESSTKSETMILILVAIEETPVLCKTPLKHKSLEVHTKIMWQLTLLVGKVAKHDMDDVKPTLLTLLQ